MNLVEGLAAQIKRVTEIKAQYESMRGMPNVIVEPQIRMMEAELKEAIEALGSGDVIRMMSIYQTLAEYSE
jgi:hypothetical protein